MGLSFIRREHKYIFIYLSISVSIYIYSYSYSYIYFLKFPKLKRLDVLSSPELTFLIWALQTLSSQENWLFNLSTTRVKLFDNKYNAHRVLRHISRFIKWNFTQDLKSMASVMVFKIDSAVLIKNVSNVITP